MGGLLTGFTLLFSLGVTLGLIWIAVAERGVEMSSGRLSRTGAVLAALLGGLLAARAVFVGLHLPYFQQHPADILALWQGGLSAPAGIVGGVLGIVLYSMRDKGKFWALIDDLALPALILSITSWIGSWFDGAAYGRRIAANWSWLMQSDPFEQQTARWPTQMVGTFLSLLAFLFLLRLYGKLNAGILAGLAVFAIAMTLFITGLFRADASLLLFGQRLDLLGPAGVCLAALILTAQRHLQGREYRS